MKINGMKLPDCMVSKNNPCEGFQAMHLKVLKLENEILALRLILDEITEPQNGTDRRIRSKQ